MPRSEGKAIKADVDSSLPHGEFRDNGGDPGDWLTLGPGFLKPLKEAWWVGAGLSAPHPGGPHSHGTSASLCLQVGPAGSHTSQYLCELWHVTSLFLSSWASELVSASVSLSIKRGTYLRVGVTFE